MWLAEYLRIDARELRSVAEGVEGRYQRIRLPRAGRAPRIIDAPDAELKSLQKLLLRRLLGVLPVSAQAHGFVRGRSIVTAAEAHAHKACVTSMDIRDFFPSVKAAAVKDALREACRDEQSVDLLVRLTTLNGCLPQGAPTSPVLANLAFRRCDARLAGLAASLDLDYTRYADDLIFSGAEVFDIAGSVRKILGEGGFELAAEKTRVMLRSERQIVCGLVVNDGVKLPREQRRRLRAVLHELRTSGPEAAARGRGDGSERWILGHLAYLASVDAEEADRLLQQMEEPTCGERDRVN